jgi:Protein of unknown function (DUF1479)
MTPTPADLGRAVREVKVALRERLAASGRTVEQVFAVMELRVADQVAEIAAARTRGEEIWPVVEYADIEAGTVARDVVALMRQRGCLVVRGHFEREQALGWDAGIVEYVERNHFFETYRGPGDDFFGSVGSRPEIYPIYWSAAQMQARLSERMARVQRFLNRLWISQSGGVQWFDPGRDAMYPDRIRRRPPGVTSTGLGPHLDAGTLDLWMTREYQQTFRHLFDGTVEQYDPWDATHRTAGPQFAGTTMCSAFRTFQGWTALSDMARDQGVLHAIPIADAMGYLMLRPLLADVADDDMCGVVTNKVFPATSRWHSLLLEALSGIPDIRAGDSVWWHCDLVHGVAPVVDQQGWGNVMYIPSAPWCPRNERYAADVRAAFSTGSSPGDFPAEHYERTWSNRFGPDDLDQAGARVLGLR